MRFYYYYYYIIVGQHVEIERYIFSSLLKCNCVTFKCIIEHLEIIRYVRQTCTPLT